MLKHGVGVNDRDALTDMTLLHYVSKLNSQMLEENQNESASMIRVLLELGANAYLRCRWTGMAAIHYASFFNNEPAVRLLLNASNFIDIDNPCFGLENATPLHIAVSNLCVESALYLIKHGADLNCKDNLGRVPLDCLPEVNSNEEQIKIDRLKKVILASLSPDNNLSLPSYENVQSKVTLNALHMKIGDKVLVGGVKTGVLKFCGQTEFSAGTWAGIELDEPAGKNDGSVAGHKYFTCPPNHGIFAPVNRISKIDSDFSLSKTQVSLKSGSKQDVRKLSQGRIDTSRVTARVDTGLKPRSDRSSEDAAIVDVGERVLVAGQRRGVVRYKGNTEFASGFWYGIELDRPVGRNDGSIDNRRYFTCKPKFGVFAPASRVQRLSDVLESVESSDTSDKSRRLSDASSGSHTGSNNTTKIKSSTRTNSWPIRRAQSFTNVGEELKLTEGTSVLCNGEIGVIRYVGTVHFADGFWLGIELKTAVGRNDGSVDECRYFTCRPDHGLIVRPSRITVRGINGAKLPLEESASPISTR